jgi:peptidoglycan/LPS O-acetylase OafA/YrhL
VFGRAGDSALGVLLWGFLPRTLDALFIISGFVICMSAWGRSVGDFFVSRVVRLYPSLRQLRTVR